VDYSPGRKNKSFTEPFLDLQTTNAVQIGLPDIPEAGSGTHFAIMNQWLKNCNDNHPLCTRAELPQFMPTRLLDVGNRDLSTRLYHTQSGDSGRFIALSHKWGESERVLFSTPADLERLERGIDENSLPPNFRDAITITRTLGIRYLWIDALCIIHGPNGDFDYEANHVEKIFSSAYCVIAASQATGQHDGFLRRGRHPREYVEFSQKDEAGASLYVCPCIDDFDGDVLNSPLGQRAWALQERAFARRTIFFGSSQTYWECGDGVRCETLTKMKRYAFTIPSSFPTLDSLVISGIGYGFIIPKYYFG
jgi:hypothetical protein